MIHNLRNYCPHCRKLRDREVMPFNTEEGVETVCLPCFRELPSEKIRDYATTELARCDKEGYFFAEQDGLATATANLTRYVNYLKGLAEKPFDPGILIIA